MAAPVAKLITSRILQPPTPLKPEEIMKINKTIKTITNLIFKIEQRGDKPIKQYALKGAFILKKLRYDDALADFNKAIELGPDSADALIAYKQRALVYSIKRQYDQAIADLNKAKGLPGVGSESVQEIEGAIRELEQKKKPASSDPSALHPMQSGIGSAFLEGQGKRAVGSIAFFQVFKSYLEGDEDHMPHEQRNESSTIYWRGIGFCAKENYPAARDEFEKLVKLKGADSLPAFVFFSLATAYYKLEDFDKSLENIEIAIKKLDTDYRYYLLRSIVHEKLGHVEESKKDNAAYLELAPPPPEIIKTKRMLDEATKLVELYDQAKTDKNTYYDILKTVVEEGKASVSDAEFHELTPESLRGHLEKAGISIFPTPENIYDAVSSDIYGQLERIGVMVEPKRGETLQPLEELHFQRARCLLVLAKYEDNHERLESAFEEINKVLEMTKESTRDLYVKALVIRAFMFSHCKDSNRTREDVNAVLEIQPDNEEIKTLLAKMNDES